MENLLCITEINQQQYVCMCVTLEKAKCTFNSQPEWKKVKLVNSAKLFLLAKQLKSSRNNP